MCQASWRVHPHREQLSPIGICRRAITLGPLLLLLLPVGASSMDHVSKFTRHPPRIVNTAGVFGLMSRDQDGHRKSSTPGYKTKTPSCSDAFFGGSFKQNAFKLIIIIFAGLTIKDLYCIISSWWEDPTVSDIKMIFNDSMTMPNFTFCMSKKQALSHFVINETEPVDAWDALVDERLAAMPDHDSFIKEQWPYQLVLETYALVSTFSSMERETTPHGSAHAIHMFKTAPRLAGRRLQAEKWMKVIKDRNVTFAELSQKVGTECLRRSLQRFKRETYNEDDVIRTGLNVTWISDMELCFQPTWTPENLKAIEEQGTFFTLMLSHNTDIDEAFDCMSVDMHGRPSSLNRFMEGKGRAKDGLVMELCLGMRHTVTVEVRAYYEMLENKEEGTMCRDVEDEMDSEFNCRSRCRMNMLREICNCTAPTLSYLVDDDELDKYPICDYTQCTVDVQKGNYSDADCTKECIRDCKQIRFQVDHESAGRMVRPDLTMIQLQWGAFEYVFMEQEKKWSFSEFISALGGSIGMWLGLSILSLIQGGTYLYEEILMKKCAKGKSAAVEDSDEVAPKKSTNNKKKSSVGANPFSNPFEIEKSPMPNQNVSNGFMHYSHLHNVGQWTLHALYANTAMA